MHQASVGFHCPECTKSGKQKVYQGLGSLRTPPLVTQVLIAINVAVFLLGVVLDGGGALSSGISQADIDFGLFAKAFDGTAVVGVGEGQWYRMITSGFLHGGLIHIGFNMYILWMLGKALESGAGRLRYGLVYVAGLVGGSLGALLFSPGGLTVGASGAVFGLVGAILAAHRAQGISFRDSPLFGFVVLNGIITVLLPGISIGGHVGGLLAGAVSGWILLDYGRRPGVDKRIPFAACGALIALCLIGGVVYATGWQPG